MTTVTRYTNDNGMIVCARHGGQYLADAIAAKPNAKRHPTPLGTWKIVDAAMLADFAAMDFTCCCEVCGA
jgi:hypothetical protein